MNTKILLMLAALAFPCKTSFASNSPKDGTDKKSMQPSGPQKLQRQERPKEPEKVPRLTQSERDEAEKNRPKGANKIEAPRK
jgi:hypothetical protein